jgi:hypothetical protein
MRPREAKMSFALPIRTRCHIKTIVKDSGHYHEIVHAGVAFTPPHEHSPERHFRRKARECGKFLFIWLATPRGLTSKEALADKKPWNGKSSKLLIPAQDGHLAQALEAS